MKNILLLLCLFALNFSFAQDHKLLIYTHNGIGNGNPYIHANIDSGVAALKKLARENNYITVESDDPAFMTVVNLADIDCIIFANTNNQAFDTQEQKDVFVKYIQGGGGFVGIHSASGSERNWPWFQAMLGGKFKRHPKLQEFEIEVIDQNHPATDFLGSTWTWEDEPYYLHNLNPDIHILLAIDYTKLQDGDNPQIPGEQFGKYTPLSWSHTFDGGRQFYTALGHKSEYYKDPTFLKHILGGIKWVIEDK